MQPAMAPDPRPLTPCFDRTQTHVLMTLSVLQTWDAFDFFTVSLTVSDLSETFNKSTADITWGITLVLMFRCKSFPNLILGDPCPPLSDPYADDYTSLPCSRGIDPIWNCS